MFTSNAPPLSLPLFAMAVQGYYYGDSGSGELPSAEAVLSKLKSDGTFDRIRKLCVAAVQEEVRPSVSHYNAVIY